MGRVRARVNRFHKKSYETAEKTEQKRTRKTVTDRERQRWLMNLCD